MIEELRFKLEKGEKNKVENQLVTKKLKKSKPKNLDRVTHDAHDEVFEKIDCLDCANRFRQKYFLRRLF